MLDGREHGGIITAEGRRVPQARAVYTRVFTAANMWRETVGNNLTTTGKVLGLQQTQETTDANTLNTIQSHSQGAVGQVQAIQAGNELASANGKELHQINQTVIAQTQMQADQMAVDADRQSAEDAAMAQFLTTRTQQTTGGMRF